MASTTLTNKQKEREREREELFLEKASIIIKLNWPTLDDDDDEFQLEAQVEFWRPKMGALIFPAPKRKRVWPARFLNN